MRASTAKRLAVGIFWALACGPASAQAPRDFAAVEAKLASCLVQANGVTPSVANCNERARASADSILNRIYGDWVAQLKHPAKADAGARKS